MRAEMMESRWLQRTLHRTKRKEMLSALVHLLHDTDFDKTSAAQRTAEGATENATEAVTEAEIQRKVDQAIRASIKTEQAKLKEEIDRILPVCVVQSDMFRFLGGVFASLLLLFCLLGVFGILRIANYEVDLSKISEQAITKALDEVHQQTAETEDRINMERDKALDAISSAAELANHTILTATTDAKSMIALTYTTEAHDQMGKLIAETVQNAFADTELAQLKSRVDWIQQAVMLPPQLAWLPSFDAFRSIRVSILLLTVLFISGFGVALVMVWRRMR